MSINVLILESVGSCIDEDGNTFSLNVNGTPDTNNPVHFSECTEEWYDGLEFKDGKGYDHINKNIPGQLYDAKCFTPRGSNFSPSVMLGAGRKVDEEKLWEHANEMIYIFCDVVSFPEVRVIFKRGSDLKKYSKGKIPFGDRDVLFG